MGAEATLDLARSSSTWQSLYQQELVDLGEVQHDSALTSIYSPLYDRSEVAHFMSGYYESLDSARKQADSFDLTDYYYGLLKIALERVDAGHKRSERAEILELGCGFGSATFPLLRLFPRGTVIASEFSVAMLTILKEKLVAEDPAVQERCGLLQLNAEKLYFRENAFDFVVGAALLHHLFEPEKVLEGCLRILKPGGHAIFFEPFEMGMSIINLIYRAILKDPRALLLSPWTRRYMKSAVSYWSSMVHLAKDNSFFHGADDKWLFTRDFFESHAARLGFGRCLTYSISTSDRPFEAMVMSHFKGNGMPAPKRWMLKIVDRFEKHFSTSMKKDLFTEGALILTK